MTEFTSKSGAKIAINPAPFEAAQNLWSAMQKAAAEKKLGEGFFKEQESLLNLVLGIDSTETFRAALWPCLVRCTRDGKKIDKNTFEDKEARKEYYDIVAACVEENCGPFVESLFSTLGAFVLKMATKPPQEPSDQKPE